MKDRFIGITIFFVSLTVAFLYLVTLFYPTWLSFFGVNSAIAVQFWIVAIPVFIGFMGLLVIGAWIGWSMATTPSPKPIEEIPNQTADTM